MWSTRQTLGLLLWALLGLQAVYAHTIDLPASTKECFFEDLHADDKMTVTYQVAGGGHLDVDFNVRNPKQSTMFKQTRKDTGTYSFTAKLDGRYTYCFSNQFSSVTTKTVMFTVSGVMYIDDDGHTAPIEKEIRNLSGNLDAIKGEQNYMVTRERLHRNTAESTNDRVKWWSILQTIMLFSVCAWQVYYLRRFFESKSVGRLV